MNKKKIDVYSLIKREVEKLKKIGNKTASLDCRLLLSQILKKTNTVYTHQEVYISQNQIIKFQTLVKKREEGQPVSRILNRRNFWKREFILDEETLDPRPDSEILIETVLEHFSDNTLLLKILDLGSGSGCLGLSLLEEYENASITFVDASKKSLKIVKRNALLFKLKGKSKYTGKKVNKDKKKGKSTIINLVGYNYAYDYAINLKKKILRNLEKHRNKANDLKNIINFILERKY